MADLSIVIVNYNTRDRLHACLDSVACERGELAIEIIVVDNGSTDGSPAMVRDFGPDVMLIVPGRNTWFSGGNNIGVEAASAAIVLLLNPDTLVQPGMLQTMREYLTGYPGVGAVTCQQVYPDGDTLYTCSMQPRYADLLLDDTILSLFLRPLRNRRRKRRWYADWARDSDKAVEVAPGSCIMTYRELLLSFGGFDEALKLYFTDDDLCKEIRNSGQEIHFVSAATVLHYEKSSVRGLAAMARRIYFEDMLAYCRKHYGAWRTLLLWLLLWPTRLSMAVMQRLRAVSLSIMLLATHYSSLVT